MTDPLAELYRAGGRADKHRFADCGSVCEGTVVDLRSVQLREYGTDQPQVWSDGTVRITPILTLDTGGGVLAAVFLTGGVFSACSAACRQRWPTAPTIEQLRGLWVRVERTADVPGERPGSRRHMFAATISDAAPSAPASSAPAQRDLHARFTALFAARWSEVCDARGWGATGPGEHARRAVLRAWYRTDALSAVTDGQILAADHGGRWLRDVATADLLAAVAAVVGAP